MMKTTVMPTTANAAQSGWSFRIGAPGLTVCGTGRSPAAGWVGLSRCRGLGLHDARQMAGIVVLVVVGRGLVDRRVDAFASFAVGNDYAEGRHDGREGAGRHRELARRAGREVGDFGTRHFERHATGVYLV